MLVFLDFDGVLHRFFPLPGVPDEENAHFHFMPHFARAVMDSGVPVEIVISSTWRRKYELSALRSNFPRSIAHLVVGVTPTVGSGAGPGARQVEVEAWLAAQGRDGEAWVGVDDFPSLYQPGAAVVACQDQFAELESQLLIEALRDPAGFALAHPVRADDVGNKSVLQLGCA